MILQSYTQFGGIPIPTLILSKRFKNEKLNKILEIPFLVL